MQRERIQFAAPRVPMGEGSKRGRKIATSRTWRRGWSAGGTTSLILSPLIFSLEVVLPGARRKRQVWDWAAASGSAPRVCAWGEISDRRGECGHGEADSMSERSSRVYTRRGILDKRALVVRWMSKVALRVYTRDVISDGGGPPGRQEASLMSDSASHVYTREALSDSG